MTRKPSISGNLLRRSLFISTVSAAALTGGIIGSPANAQTDDSAAGTEVIMVTATRRAERLVDVAAPVTVLSPSTLQLSGVKDLGDYLFSQPGVNLNRTGVPGRGEITIRGISTGNLTTPAVAVYVDDVPIGSALAAVDGTDAFDQTLLDLQRIEVLRGPQGTLFGVSSLGGALRYITEEPDYDDLKGRVFTDVSFTDEGGVNTTLTGAINIPINEKVSVRAAGVYSHDGGYVDAIGSNGGEDLNSGDIYGGRVTLGLRPTDQFEARIGIQYQRTNYNGLAFVDVDPMTLEPTVGDLTAGNLLFDENQELELQLYTLNLKYDFDFAELLSITSYQRKTIDRQQDFSDTGIFFGPFVGQDVIATIDDRFSEVEKFTQEIRLVSNSDGPLKWQGGLFYTTEDGFLGQNLVQTLSDGTVADGVNSPLFFGPDSGFDTKYEEIAAYFSVDYEILDRLTLSGGLRVAHNEIEIDANNDGFFAGAPNNGSETDETPVTFLATIRYALDDEKNVYFRVASGYRAGGPNVGLVDPSSPTGVAQNPPTYDSDSLINYELGYKGAHLDGRLNIDASAYWIDWSDIQQSVASGNFTAFTGNAGAARVRGLELGINAQPNDIISFGGTFTYLDAEITEGDPTLLIPLMAGDRLPGSAEIQFSLFAQVDYEFGDYPVFARLEHSYLDERLTAFQAQGNAITMPDFHQTDFSAGVEVGQFQVGVYARNIGNNRGILGVLPPDVPGLQPANATFVRPRTIGVSLTADF